MATFSNEAQAFLNAKKSNKIIQTGINLLWAKEKRAGTPPKLDKPRHDLFDWVRSRHWTRPDAPSCFLSCSKRVAQCNITLLQHELSEHEGEELSESEIRDLMDNYDAHSSSSTNALFYQKDIWFVKRRPKVTLVSLSDLAQDRQTSFGRALFGRGIASLHQLFKLACKWDNTLKHPLIPLFEEFLTHLTTRNIRTATVDAVNDCAPLPKHVGDINGARWGIYGSNVDIITVDNEPITSRITDLSEAGRIHFDSPSQANGLRVYTPYGSDGGPQYPINFKRQSPRLPIDLPVALIAFKIFGGDLRSSLAQDVAHLLTIAYISNQSLVLTPHDGAHLLAQSEEGSPRNRIRASDEQRFENAFMAMRFMCVFLEDSRGVVRMFELVDARRLDIKGTVLIGKPEWWNRSHGNWTLTSAFGRAAQNRLRGDAHQNQLWRVPTGAETWLARSPFSTRGQHAGIASALIPANGRSTGAGAWYDMDWRLLLTLSGDSWNRNDKTQEKRERKRWDTIRESLSDSGYVVGHLNRPAPAGDTVEFMLMRGGVKVRASQRFCEAARKAKRQDFERIPLTDFIGF